MTTQSKEFVPRVNQLDAVHLNKDITRLIKENFLENLQAISPVLYLKVQPELDLLVQSAIWLGSVGKHCSSFGQQLLVLSYESEKLTISRLCLHFALTVLPKYVKSNAEYRLHNKDWVHKTIEWCENIALILSVLNFFRFLKTGKKPTLVDYLLGLDYISLRKNQRREVGYKYMTRELIWGGFMELLGLVLPIINFQKISRQIQRAVFGSSNKNLKRNLGTSPSMKHDSCCSYCGERPVLPHYIACEHVYCYYCLEANTLTDSRFSCTICGQECIDGIHRVEFSY